MIEMQTYIGDGVYVTVQPELDRVMLTTGHHEEERPTTSSISVLQSSST